MEIRLMEKEKLTQAQCEEKIIELLLDTNREKDYKKAADFLSYLGFKENDENGKRMIQRALYELKKNTIRIDPKTKNFEYINQASINDESLSKLLATEVKTHPELIISSHSLLYFLPLESKWANYIIALIAKTSLALHIITMTPTYNGILIYVKSSSKDSFMNDFIRINKLSSIS